VVGGESHADVLADAVVVVARHQGQHAPAARQLERVEELGAPEYALNDARTPRRVVVVHDIVRPEQHVDHSAASGCLVTLAQRAELGL
jgi:hypothetical protein